MSFYLSNAMSAILMRNGGNIALDKPTFCLSTGRLAACVPPNLAMINNAHRQ